MYVLPLIHSHRLHGIYLGLQGLGREEMRRDLTMRLPLLPVHGEDTVAKHFLKDIGDPHPTRVLRIVCEAVNENEQGAYVTREWRGGHGVLCTSTTEYCPGIVY